MADGKLTIDQVKQLQALVDSLDYRQKRMQDIGEDWRRARDDRDDAKTRLDRYISSLLAE